MRKTEIAPWNSKWNELYEIESRKIATILENELVEIHHIGSTSVQQIGYAKPIIDILVVVKDIANIDKHSDLLMEIDYIPKGENGILNRRYFTKGGEQRTHHLHCHQVGDDRIHAHLSFKRYMINHPDDARAYGELKQRLAKQFPDDTHLYQSGKEAFLSNVVWKAIEWSKAMDRKALLIQTMLDSNATEAEKDDCAMELASYNNIEVVDVLFKFANELSNESMVRGSCGESLAEIWIRNKEVNFDLLIQLKDIALFEALALIKHHRPDWYERYNQLRS